MLQLSQCRLACTSRKDVADCFAPRRVEQRALFRGEPCARRTPVLRRAARGLRVVASYDFGELASGDATDLDGDDCASERAARARPDLIDEVRASALALAHLGGD